MRESRMDRLARDLLFGFSGLRFRVPGVEFNFGPKHARPKTDPAQDINQSQPRTS